MQVKLKKEDFQAMAAHAVAHLPEEACGLIAGEKSDTERVIKKVYYLTNIDHTNEHFSLDPKEQLAAIKDMRKNGLEPLGNWLIRKHQQDRHRKISALPLIPKQVILLCL